MATLKTNYKDDLFSGSRKYEMIRNQDGTVSFEDVTDYLQEGDPFGSTDINVTNTEVNAINQNLTENGKSFKFGYDPQDDVYGYYKEEGGADTFVPFSSNDVEALWMILLSKVNQSIIKGELICGDPYTYNPAGRAAIVSYINTNFSDYLYAEEYYDSGVYRMRLTAKKDGYYWWFNNATVSASTANTYVHKSINDVLGNFEVYNTSYIQMASTIMIAYSPVNPTS